MSLKKEDMIKAANAYCPFYKAATKVNSACTIRCESPLEGNDVRNGYTDSIDLQFRSQKEWNKYFDTYCSNKNCENCFIYALNMDKYLSGNE